MLTYEKYEEYRNKKNLTDSKVAEQIGISKQALSLWRLKKINKLKTENMLKIANLLDIPFEKVVEIKSDENKSFLQKIFGR